VVVKTGREKGREMMEKNAYILRFGDNCRVKDERSIIIIRSDHHVSG
jgi:hypothetical protein